MFESPINNFAPNMGTTGFSPGVFPNQCTSPAAHPSAIQLGDIYQAAQRRAIEDHEIDKLFNPDPDDFGTDDDFQI